MTEIHSNPSSRQVGAVHLDVRGETVVLRGDRTLYWPTRRWLIVADVHLGKTESLRRDGVALPDAVMTDDLGRLRRAVQQSGAERLIVLGDLIHDAFGSTADVVGRVAAWRAEVCVDVALVPGNHDRRVAALPAEWDLAVLPPALRERPFLFSHERALDSDFNWHGHEHPVLTLHGRGDRLRLPGFVVDDTTGMLPAFSVLTGGSVQRLVAGSRGWVVVDGEVVPVTIV